MIKGSPFIFHNGEIRLQPSGAETRLDWTIRFRSKVPLLGVMFQPLIQIQPLMQIMLSKMVKGGLKP